MIGVDPADVTGNTVFFGGAGNSTAAGTTLLRSTDGGQTFGDVSKVGDGTFLHANQHAIAFTVTAIEDLCWKRRRSLEFRECCQSCDHCRLANLDESKQ